MTGTAKNTAQKDEVHLQYLRIGTDYYKIIKQPLASKDTIEKIVKWLKQTIKEDHGDNILRKIPKYDSFCLIPNHENYEREVHNSYNLYEPVIHKPKKGNWPKIEYFLNHIFREQYEIGLDYLTIIWKHPTQVLPILCLVSQERNTGKTTFLLFLKEIFGKNMTFNTNEDFRTHFNSGWASKLIIGVDEVFLEKKEDAEKLKNLSTSRLINSEAKGKDRFEQEFFGKFVLCSNNETEFIQIDSDEIRYWIRKIPQFKEENKDLLTEMKKEIPAFLHFLSTREIKTPNQTRMWFTKEQLWTDALKNVMRSGTSPLEKEIRILIVDQFLHFELDEVRLTPKDVIELLKHENNFFAKKSDVINILQKQWGYNPLDSPAYYKRWRYSIDNEGNEYPTTQQKNGRYYTFKKDNFLEKS
jgi:hypothetical protein